MAESGMTQRGSGHDPIGRSLSDADDVVKGLLVSVCFLVCYFHFILSK